MRIHHSHFVRTYRGYHGMLHACQLQVASKGMLFVNINVRSRNINTIAYAY
jgi:hypothetical protein